MQTPTRGDEPLVRAIGTLALAAGIVNITIGGGIFRLPSLVAASLGPAAPVAYVVCARFGLDTGERSFPYVATWSQDQR